MSSSEEQRICSSEKDIELGVDIPAYHGSQDIASIDASLNIDEQAPSNRFLKWMSWIENRLGFEARGIRRVERIEQTAETTLSFSQIVILWLSINTTSQNIIIGWMAESFNLNFKDAVLCSVLGAIVGCIPVAYAASWGPVSGNRSLITARFSMGWWPVKLCVILNLVSLIGYSMIGAVICGQILSAVSPNSSITVEVGIAIAAVLTFVVTTFGIQLFHRYARYAWIPQIAALLIFAGTAGPHFDTEYDFSKINPDPYRRRNQMANRLSFFSVCLSSAITYSSGAANYFVYCNPKITSRWKVFAGTFLGLGLSFTLTFTLGCGLASGIRTNQTWRDAGLDAGALIAAAYAPLGSLGKVCAVITALGLVSNMIPPIYCSGIDFQILGRYPAMVPRFVWNTIAIAVVACLALAGKDNLLFIFANFLAIMGYWVVLWTAISLEEEFIFRRRKPGYVWSDWKRQKKLPIGIAAFLAFCIGAVGTMLSSATFYYTGPIARLLGQNGVDMGNYAGFTLVGLVFPPLRWLELRRFGR